jgi:hypothetical protein
VGDDVTRSTDKIPSDVRALMGRRVVVMSQDVSFAIRLTRMAGTNVRVEQVDTLEAVFVSTDPPTRLVCDEHAMLAIVARMKERPDWLALWTVVCGEGAQHWVEKVLRDHTGYPVVVVEEPIEEADPQRLFGA